MACNAPRNMSSGTFVLRREANFEEVDVSLVFLSRLSHIVCSPWSPLTPPQSGTPSPFTHLFTSGVLCLEIRRRALSQEKRVPSNTSVLGSKADCTGIGETWVLVIRLSHIVFNRGLLTILKAFPAWWRIPIRTLYPINKQSSAGHPPPQRERHWIFYYWLQCWSPAFR